MTNSKINTPPSKLDKKLLQAVTLHRAGRLKDAERIYREILKSDLQHSDANHNLGALAVQTGKPALGLPFFKAALAANPNHGQYWLSYIDALNKAGQHDLAQQVLAEARQKGLAGEGADPPGLRLPEPTAAEVNELVSMFNNGRYTEAEILASGLTQRFPQHGFAWKVLGFALMSQGRSLEAREPLQKAAELLPIDPEVHFTLGNSLRSLGRLSEAETSYRKALESRPDYVDALFNLGATFKDLGRLGEAEACYLQALKFKPDYAEVLNNLGNIQRELGRLDEAEASLRRAIDFKPELADAHNNLAITQNELGRLEEAEVSYRRALEIRADYPEAHNNLGTILKALGRLSEAETCYRQALKIKPDYAGAHSNLLYLYAFTRLVSPQAECEEAAEWEKTVLNEKERAEAGNRTFNTAPLKGRKLRVGIVSAEIYQHSVAEFLEPLLANFDRSRIHTTLYPTTDIHDSRSIKLKELADEFKSLSKFTDEAAANQIRADKIDILIDTTSHMSGCRLAIFAHRAAPVQCHYIGYHGTTGLTEMDWFIADEELLPHFCDTHFSEKIWRLPRLWIAYRGDTSLPDSNWQPDKDGTIWLGSFNNLAKVRDETLRLWARTMNAIPESKLLLKDRNASDSSMQQRIRRELLCHGISGERIEFAGSIPDWKAHMALYDRLDIALDSIPLNSGTTAFDALWMGVPMVAIEGDWMGARMTSTILKALGKPEWVARNEEEYVSEVIALAHDIEGRKTMRAGQRSRMADSPLCDAKGLAMALEDAFESMFERWWTSTKRSQKSLANEVSETPDLRLAEPPAAEMNDLVLLLNQRNYIETETMASSLMERFPHHGFAWKVLGALFKSQGDLEKSMVSLQKAVELSPKDAQVHNNLGATLSDLGRLDEAEESYRHALEINPVYAEAHNNLGNTLRITGRLEDAEKSYRRALDLKPGFALAHCNLGAVLNDLGRLGEAEASYLRALDLNPDFAEVHSNLGKILLDMGRLSESEASCRRALEIRSDYAEAYYNLGNTLKELRRLEEGEASYRQALDIKPDYAEAHNNLGSALHERGRLLDAEACFRRALDIKPDFVQAYCNLGGTLNGMGRLEEAEASFRGALEIKPDYAEAYSNLGNTLKDLGRLKEAEASYRSALKIKPDYTDAYSNLLYLYAFTRIVSPQTELELASEWEKTLLSKSDRVAARKRALSREVFEGAPRKGRKLRVGFVSAEIGQHAVADFLEPLLEHFDRDRLHISIYPTTLRLEPRSTRIKNLADAVKPLYGLNDLAAANQIRSDKIDVLIDTTSHMSSCRLGIFAHRAAPVQCHYIGFHGTTGLTEMDWFIADEKLLPPFCDTHFRETIWRLPRLWIAYAGDTSLPNSNWQPSEDGTIWLGSFNNLAKVREETLRLWGRVMKAIPASKLLLKDKKAADLSVQQRILGELQLQGIDGERVEFIAHAPDWNTHMALYDRLDIALDSIPLNSGTTAFDALWMGVPMLAIEGDWMGARMTSTILNALGKTQWVARSEDEYVAKVAALARDIEGRKILRAGQRALMAKSELCDARGLAQALEDAFESMFDLWWTSTESLEKGFRSEFVDAQHQKLAEPTAEEMNELVVLLNQNRYSETEIRARQITERFPLHGFAWVVLGAVYKATGNFQKSLESLQKAVELSPEDAQAHNNLGATFSDLGRLEEAKASYLCALRIRPDYAEAHNNLGNTLRVMGRLDEAERSYRKALELKPDSALAHSNLGAVLTGLGRLNDAEVSYRRALELRPDFVEAHSNLGNILCDMGRLKEAEASCRLALELNPDYAGAYNNLGNVLKDLGRLEEAEVFYRRALEIMPDYIDAQSNLLFTLIFTECHPSYHLEEARKYGQMVTKMARQRFTAWHSVSQPKRLRIGVVSGDLRNHPVGFFLENVLSQIDQTRIELFAYTTGSISDEVTARIKPCFSAWKSLVGQNDETAARLIHADGLHLLLDLCGHIANNRLPVFARKPAPVQASWIGQQATTGVAEIDYQIGDEQATPPENDWQLSEKVWRLPDVWCCFTPPQISPEISSLPALSAGFITFGSFNNLTKMNDKVVALWSRVLIAVPGSRLFLKTRQLNDATVCETTRQRFAAHGIEYDRLILEGASSRPDLLAAYNRVDIALDPFPCPGVTTNFEALWMAVPVITRKGDRFLARGGQSIVFNAGLTEWIAEDDDDYVAKAVLHTTNPERLATLRRELRQQVLDSPLFDAPRFARNLEAALWEMWRIHERASGTETR